MHQNEEDKHSTIFYEKYLHHPNLKVLSEYKAILDDKGSWW